MSYLAVVDFDEQFHKLPFQPIIVNQIRCYTENDRAALNKLLVTVYETDNISAVPQCECGNIYGQYNIGIVCPSCNTECHDNFNTEMTSRVWMKAFTGIKAFIAPHWWWRLVERHMYKGFNLIRWCTDPLYKSPIEAADFKAKLLLDYFTPKVFQRNINFFYDNFDTIMELITFNGLHDDPNFPIKKSAYNKQNKPRVELYEFIKANRSTVFCEYLPVPDKALFIIESNDSGNYGDLTMEQAINAVKIVQETEQNIDNIKPNSLYHRVVMVILNLVDFYIKYLDRNYFKKKSNLRQHVYGGRLHFTGRAVITSITDAHDYDEIYIPWAFALHLLKLHVISKLISRDYGLYEINHLIRVSTYQTHPVIRQIFDELIAESPHKGLPVIFQRNPTLNRGSGQMLYVTKIKDEIEDNTVSLSVLVLTALNADFDGDELNCTLILDEVRWNNFKLLEAHHNIMSPTEAYELSNTLQMQPQIIATMLNWSDIAREERARIVN